MALGVIRYALKIKLIRQLKVTSYVAALISSTVIHVEFSPLTGTQNVVVGSLLGFFMPIVVAMLMKRSQNTKKVDEI